MKRIRTYDMASRTDGVAATRERIARAAMALFLEHAFEDVTLAGIAEASGVSHQTVLNHFGSKEGLVLAVAELFSQETERARRPTRSGDVAAAVGALVGEYERMGDANVRWAAAADRFPSLGEVLAIARVSHQAWIGDVFDERLPTAAAPRRRAVNALHAATDVFTWKLLRRDLSLSRQETEKSMTALVAGILEGPTQ
jgi:AcrR family transcriptional regulator